MVVVDNMSKINLLGTKMAFSELEILFFGSEKLEASMFIRSNILCHLAHDVKKNITDSGKL